MTIAVVLTGNYRNSHFYVNRTHINMEINMTIKIFSKKRRVEKL